MKNLANCRPSEFLKQTNKIRKSVEKWLTVTEIMKIRKSLPKLSDGMDIAERKEAIQEQAKKNLSLILDSIMDKHPDETLELLGLLCFIEPEDVDNHPMSEYFSSIAELTSNQEVLNFFLSLMRWGQMLTRG